MSITKISPQVQKRLTPLPISLPSVSFLISTVWGAVSVILPLRDWRGIRVGGISVMGRSRVIILLVSAVRIVHRAMVHARTAIEPILDHKILLGRTTVEIRVCRARGEFRRASGEVMIGDTKVITVTLDAMATRTTRDTTTLLTMSEVT